jgi:hypothetical protein
VLLSDPKDVQVREADRVSRLEVDGERGELGGELVRDSCERPWNPAEVEIAPLYRVAERAAIEAKIAVKRAKRTGD